MTKEGGTPGHLFMGGGVFQKIKIKKRIGPGPEEFVNSQGLLVQS